VKNLLKLGKISSACEVVNISQFGVWVLLDHAEYFLDHKSYPWFKSAEVSQVLDVQSPRHGHLRWPKLDIDLHIDAIENPGRYPLIAKKAKAKASKTKARKTKPC
jgi:hypothetical protein